MLVFGSCPGSVYIQKIKYPYIFHPKGYIGGVPHTLQMISSHCQQATKSYRTSIFNILKLAIKFTI